MIGKILSHLLWNTVDEFEAANDSCEELMEREEGEWVIVNIQENGPLSIAEADPLENLLIEHPSMSVYQMRCGVTGEEDDEEELGSDEEEDSPSSMVHLTLSGVYANTIGPCSGDGSWEEDGGPMPTSSRWGHLTGRSVVVRHHISWRLAAWGIPLPCNVQMLGVQKAEHKKMSRSALNRQNLSKTRFSSAEKRCGHFKQPCQRLYNY